MKIKYFSSSGEEYDLVDIETRIKEANFHSYDWEYESSSLTYGSKINRFIKSAKVYDATISFKGTVDKRKENINRFYEITEKDIINELPGRIVWGNYYIGCYIISSSTYPCENEFCTLKDIKILCPYPFWISETTYNFYSYDTILSTNNKKYIGRYPYRYANGLSNAYIQNPHFTDANFDLIIYGPAVNPQVTIGETPYMVNIVLEAGEYLKIDSRAGTVTKVMVNGEIVNAFHNRQKGRQFFKKIPPGRHSVSWPGTFAWDIIIYEERSEPKWNVSQQQ